MFKADSCLNKSEKRCFRELCLEKLYCEYRLNSLKEAVDALKQVKVFFPHYTFKANSCLKKIF